LSPDHSTRFPKATLASVSLAGSILIVVPAVSE